MYTSEDLTSLTNLGNGAAIEKFDIELQKVLENLIDPNKPGGKERSITLTVKFKPGETRGIVMTEIHCNSKLADQKPHNATLMIGRSSSGRMEAREMFTQRPLPIGENVVPMEQKKEE